MKEIKSKALKGFALCVFIVGILLSFQLETVSAGTGGNTYGFFVSGISGGAGNSTDVSIGKMQKVLKNNQLEKYAGRKIFRELRYNSEKNGISKSEFTKIIKGAYKNTSKNDLSIFFYNGHSSKTGISLKLNSDSELKYEELAEIIAKSTESNRILVVMDSCYSTNFYDKGMSKLSSAQRQRFITYLSAESDDTAEYFGYTARFTKAFTEGLGYSGKCYSDFDKNGMITVRELEKYIDVQMKDDLLDNKISWSDQQVFVYAKDKDFVIYKEVILKLNRKNAEIWKKDSLQLKVEKKNIDSALKWTTSNSRIATVDKNGKVRGIHEGRVVISVSGGGLNSKCSVVVKNPSLKLNKTKLSLILGKNKSYNLKATVFGPSKSVKWTSSNKEIVTVSKNGVISPKAIGTGKITAIANGVKAVCTVTIKRSTKPSIRLNKSQLTLKVGESYQLKAIVKNTSEKVSWSSSNSEIVSVSSNGKIYVNQPGSAVIIAKVGNISDNCKVTAKMEEPENETIYAGGLTSAVIKKDKTLWMWGNNEDGQVGLEKGYSIYNPQKIMSNVTKVAISSGHTLALKEDGSLWSWGGNVYGELGIGTKDYDRHYKPNKIMDHVVDIAVGNGMSAAIKIDGSLWLWGWGYYIPGNTDRIAKVTSPMKAMDGVVSVSIARPGNQGGYAVIKEDHTLWTWGYNQGGELGLGDKYDSKLPQKILSEVSKVVLSRNHGMALKLNGEVFIWGTNYNGILGNGNRKESKPVRIMNDAKDVFVGNTTSSVVIKKDNSLWMWGENGYGGKIGNNSTKDQPVPIKILDNVNSVSLGNKHTLAIRKDGTVWSWGSNDGGALGDGSNSTYRSLVPKQIL